MLCPKCHKPLDLNRLHCESGHYFSSENDVVVLMDTQLRQHVKAIYKHRDEHVSLPLISDYNMLPCGFSDQHFEWRMRCYDLAVVKSLLSSFTGNVLEIGGWNGWLTHHLVRMGNEVIAVDYSNHPNDGLGAKQYYSVSWRAIQMDVTDLSVFEDQRFDMIIVNHGLHLFPDPIEYVQSLKRLLVPAGKLILISLTFFRDPAQRIAQVKALQSRFEEQYGVPFFFKPSRGYMDFVDKARIEALGIRLKQYSQLRKANLKSKLRKFAPAYFYGVYENSNR